MLKNSRKIFLIAFGTILLPIVTFIIYEFSSLQEDELVLQKIYENQLDFVIYTANQYSNDHLDKLVDAVEQDLTEDELDLSEKSRSLLQYSGWLLMSLRPIDTVPPTPPSPPVVTQNAPSPSGTYYFPAEIDESYKKMVDSMIYTNEGIIEQLVSYKENGYRKIQPSEIVFIDSLQVQLLLAIVSDPSGKPFLFTGFIEPVAFANEVLSPKLQEIAQEDLVISLVNNENNQRVYMTESVPGEIIASKSMWLFPNFSLGISLKNKTLSDLINSRLEYNLIASGILILLLLVGFTLVARTIFQQMQLAQTKSDFVSNVSHELRTPLALISMFAETLLLQRVKKEEKKQEYIEIIFKETNRLTRIVNRILNFSQVEADRKKYHFVRMDLNTVVEELAHDYSFHLEQNGFEFHSQLSDIPLHANVDKETVYEAMVNLIDNAIKYSKESKSLEITTEARGETGVVSVKDSGIGIPKEKIKQIFEKFYRVAEGDVHDVQGAGLGLSLVSSIMEAHDGHIDVESQPGNGSTFSLVFKLIQ